MRRKIPESETIKLTNRCLMITPEGYEKLKEEFNHLWRVERPEVTAKVSWAASLGDRSENADYHYNKKRLRQIDKRIRYLRVCIDEFKVVEYHPNQEGKVMFGAWVEIENQQKGFKRKIRIVGSEELSANSDYISMDSPVAKSLMKKCVGDQAIVKAEVGEMVWRINSIEYQK
jgi:transcription elongation factor GreB